MQTSHNATVVVTNPTLQRVLFEIANVLESAQGDSHVRRVKAPENYSLNEVFNTNQGVIKIHGGQPGQRNGGYTAGQTSRLGIAWWSDRNGNKHVRIEADRTQVSNFSVPEIFPSIEPHEIVFQDDLFCCECNYGLKVVDGHWKEDLNFSCDTFA